jgi:NADPH-dependent curcumin reductase
VQFENVGGAVLEAALGHMNRNGRIVVCGLVAEYSATEAYRYRGMRSILVNRIRMQGMIVFDWKERYGEARRGLAALVAAGRLRYRESVTEGLENAPRALVGLLRGENFGKQLVRLAD